MLHFQSRRRTFKDNQWGEQIKCLTKQANFLTAKQANFLAFLSRSEQRSMRRSTIWCLACSKVPSSDSVDNALRSHREKLVQKSEKTRSYLLVHHKPSKRRYLLAHYKSRRCGDTCYREHNKPLHEYLNLHG